MLGGGVSGGGGASAGLGSSAGGAWGAGGSAAGGGDSGFGVSGAGTGTDEGVAETNDTGDRKGGGGVKRPRWLIAQTLPGQHAKLRRDCINFSL